MSFFFNIGEASAENCVSANYDGTTEVDDPGRRNASAIACLAGTPSSRDTGTFLDSTRLLLKSYANLALSTPVLFINLKQPSPASEHLTRRIERNDRANAGRHGHAHSKWPTGSKKTFLFLNS
jgi:hypothetical protein